MIIISFCYIQWNSHLMFLEIKVFLHSTFNLNNVKSTISVLLFPLFRIFLNFVFKSTAPKEILNLNFTVFCLDSYLRKKVYPSFM
jgi:hypothetical protein